MLPTSDKPPIAGGVRPPSFLDRPFGSGIEKKLLESINAMTLADIDTVVAMHKSEIPAGIMVELGTEFLRLFYRQVVMDPEARGYVARQNGRIVGFMVGSSEPGVFLKGLFSRNFFRIGKIVGKRIVVQPSFLLRFAQVVLANLHQETVAESLAGAVLKEYQGGGYGFILLKKLFHDFRQSGVRRVQCVVAGDTSDPAVIALHHIYKNNGFFQSGKFRVGKTLYSRYRRDLV